MSRRAPKTKVYRPQGASYHVTVIGAKPQRFRDIYHIFLRVSWGVAFSLILLGFLLENLLFGSLFWLVGGISNAQSWPDYFFFSVQTSGTIGYGAMFPQGLAAHLLVTIESGVALIFTAIATGLVFAKFSQPNSQMVFSKKLAIAPNQEGIPTLTLRVGNERGNQIIEATIRLVMVKTLKDKEGKPFYRMLDLPLLRERSPAISRSWTVMHEIDEKSPLYQYNTRQCEKEEVEIIATVMGTDDTSMQPIYGRHSYESKDICWNARYVDILTESSDGNLVLDLTRFDEVRWL
jgi:inward rectifier potassium channel